MVIVAALWERLVLLAPALVIGLGLVAGVLILLGRAFADTVRESGHPRLVYVGLAVVAGFVGLLTYLGVTLPSE